MQLRMRVRRCANAALRIAAAALIAGAAAAGLQPAQADEGGVSFWLPGGFGSLAAAPKPPGWSFGTLYIHTSVSGGGSETFRLGGTISAGIAARSDLVAFVPGYTLEQPVLGGQLGFSLMAVVARVKASADAVIVGPLGNTFAGHRSDTVTGLGDLYPQATLRWNQGVHNFMVYGMGDIPVGTYKLGRLANVSINHWAIDGGAGYTYLDPKSGHEASAVAGVTYNFINPDTNYRNGVDFHLDVAASHFFTEHFHAGVAGYWYQQLTGDSGSGATLGSFKSRVFGVGPQIGYFLPMGSYLGYVNVKGFKEFGHENRPQGWNVWLTFAITAAPPRRP